MHLYPRDAPRTRLSHAEVALYDALKRCDRLGWSAWHSLRLRTAAGLEGEGDFVLADPERGLLVLEVKGGNLELRDGRWRQNGRPLDKPPRDQAQGFVRKLVEELKRAGAEVPPFGVACAFPECEFSSAPGASDLRGLVLGARDLPWLETVLPDVLATALPRREPPRSRAWVKALTDLWGETWVPTVSLSDQVADAHQRTLALDREQLQLLDYAQGTRRALVEGGAGTGKTILAAELARRRARAGQRTLYLCFTDALAEAVERQFAREPFEGPRPRAAAIRQFAVDLLEQGGPVAPRRADAEFWSTVSLQAACDALPPAAERPEMVIVDESQDFDASDWMLVEQLAGDRGLWIFADPHQAFWSRRELPPALRATLGAQLALLRKYRCPPALAAWADLFSGPPPASIPAPDRSVVRLVEAEPDALADRLRHELDALRRQGARPQDIAILSLAGQTKSALFHSERLGTHRLVHAHSAEAHQHTVVDTFLRFKGLERPFVFVTELAGAHVTHFATRMHIAATRATVGLVVFAPRDLVEADPRLQVLRAER